MSGTRHFTRKLLILSISTVAFFLSSFSAILASDFSGSVVSVLDGDTIEVLHNTSPERIRLSGIDCPEKGQAFGNRAKQAASALVFGRDVILQTHGQDKYKRTLADVFLKDGTNVNHELVKEGWCWWYRKYAPGDTVLEGLENEAREAKKGLWADPAPIPPWAYRKAKRGQALDFSDMVPLNSDTGNSGSSRGQPVSPVFGAVGDQNPLAPLLPILSSATARVTPITGQVVPTTAKLRLTSE